MSLLFVIDGYNIIHHPAFSKENRFKNPQESLLKILSAKRLCGKNKATVIFDGYPPQDFLGTADIQAIFSRKISADERIKKEVESFGNPRNIVVVSDDNEVRFFAKSARARVLSVEEFINPKEKSRRKKDEPAESELTFSQMENINKELRKIWLK